MSQPGESSGRALRSDGRQPAAGIARDLSDVARRLNAEVEPTSLLTVIAQSARDNIPGAAAAGITMLENGRYVSIATTEALVQDIDALQYKYDEGPCLAALREHSTVRIDDMSTEVRWPTFAREAFARGICSVLSFQLYGPRGPLAALNLYAMAPRGFTAESEDIGLLFASHAAIALAGAQAEANLRTAISSRDVIGQAKGILMERHKITGDQAFELLIRRSQRDHRKLRVVAEDLTSTGDFPLD